MRYRCSRCSNMGFIWPQKEWFVTSQNCVSQSLKMAVYDHIWALYHQQMYLPSLEALVSRVLTRCYSKTERKKNRNHFHCIHIKFCPSMLIKSQRATQTGCSRSTPALIQPAGHSKKYSTVLQWNYYFQMINCFLKNVEIRKLAMQCINTRSVSQWSVWTVFLKQRSYI